RLCATRKCWPPRDRPRCCMQTTCWWWSVPKTASPRSYNSSITAEPVQISAPLLFQLGAVLAALALLGTVARRFALSPIPVYLLAGFALGNGGVAPVTTAGQFITTGAPIGVVLLLLTLGLEFSTTEFASSLRRHLPSAAVDIVLNATDRKSVV